MRARQNPVRPPGLVARARSRRVTRERELFLAKLAFLERMHRAQIDGPLETAFREAVIEAAAERFAAAESALLDEVGLLLGAPGALRTRRTPRAKKSR